MKSTLKYLFVFIGCMFISPLISHAQCSYERTAELSRIASNVQFGYTYEVTGDVTYNVTMTNLVNDIYVVDNYNNTFVGETEMNKAPANSLKYTIYSNDNDCRGEILVTKYLSLPVYNYFSKMEACKQYPNFRYCQMWENTRGVSEADFNNALEQYKTNELSKENVDENKVGIFERILAVFDNTYFKTGFTILLIVVLIGTAILVYWHKKHRQRR